MHLGMRGSLISIQCSHHPLPTPTSSINMRGNTPLHLSPSRTKRTHRLRQRQKRRGRSGVGGGKKEKIMMMMERKDSPPEVVLGELGEGRGKNSSVRTAETLLRIVPMALCVAALVVMLKNAQTNDFGSVNYSDIGGFRYLVYANGICAGYSLISAFYTAIPRYSTMSRAWTIFFFDQVLTYVILAAGTVSAEVIYLAYKGDEAITWSEACGVFGGFCRKATASVGITFAAVACYAALSLISSYRLFSNYDAPISYPGKGVEIAAFPG